MTRHDSRPDAVASHPAGVVRVLTRNVYVGAQVDAVFDAPSPELLAHRVGAVLREVLASRFPDRARRLARELAETDADVIGLQEVARLTRRRADEEPPEVILDYLDILLAELRALGARYEPVSICQAADVELPLADRLRARLTARNVILAREHLPVTASASACYATNLSVSAGGTDGPVITMLRGWAAVNVAIGERVLRVVNTHLETQAHAELQRAQCRELLEIASEGSLPVVIVGDFNSDAHGRDTDSHALMLDAGLRDAWREVRDDAGLTCCQAADLRNATSALTKRIDHILVRGPVDVLDAELVGAGDDSRTPDGLWASDHAGVVATLRLAA